ncbi:hypothetical protein JOF53_003143 [Crossiella equi]|uniref:Uncharacterized protein n=1 Tax=Crossiella equi TaxID=130796 RepID=A0ABS5ACH5_9PSEU|nr:hypothetical protein [Crossiella equi]MBP2474271.1 hypothetical protein [Crossiella equi]
MMVMFALAPCASTTGSGWAALGLHDQSLAPGGDPGSVGGTAAEAAPTPKTVVHKAVTSANTRARAVIFDTG